MEKAQDKWFQRLRDLAEQALKNQSVDPKNIDSADISKLINNIQVFQAELEMLHKCRDDLMQKPFSRFIAPEDQNIFRARFSPFYKNPENC